MTNITTSAETATVINREREQANEQYTFAQRIGSTLYKVNVTYSGTSRETIEDRILGLIKSRLTNPESCSIMNILQTGRLSERGAI